MLSAGSLTFGDLPGRLDSCFIFNVPEKARYRALSAGCTIVESNGSYSGCKHRHRKFRGVAYPL
jgi:hypothetical protein